MEKKVAKLFVLSLFSLVLISLVANSVYAATNADIVFDKVTEFLRTSKIDPTTLSSILLGVLLWIVLYTIVAKIFGNKRKAGLAWGAAGISLIIVIITFLYLPANFVEAIALQYGAMGATILTVIPFAIMLYFTTVVSDSLLVARGIWLFYAIYYFAIFLYKVADSDKVWSASNIPYFAAIAAGIAMIILVGYMRGVMFKTKIDADTEKAMKNIKVRKTLRDIETEDAAAHGIGTS